MGAVQALFFRGRSPRVHPPGLIVSRFLSVRGALTSQILRKCLRAYAHSKRAFRSSRSGTLRLKTRYHPFRSARSRLFKDLFWRSQITPPPEWGQYVGENPPWGRPRPAVTPINVNAMPKTALCAKCSNFLTIWKKNLTYYLYIVTKI